MRAAARRFLLAVAVLASPAQASTPARLGQPRAVALRDICEPCVAERFTRCGNFLEGPAFDAAGNLWMVSVESGDIHKVTPDGRCATVANTGGAPRGLAFHEDGRLFGADAERGIFVLDTATGALGDYVRGYQGQSLLGPNDLVFDEQGGLYFTDPGAGPTRSTVLAPAGAVYYVSPEPAREVRLLVGGLAYPNGVALAPSGRALALAESAAKRILAIGLSAPGVASGSEVSAYLPGDGLAIDAEGNLYVAQPRGGGIVVLDREGLVVGSITLPQEAGPTTTNLTFHAGHLYVTEARRNEVWRVAVKKQGAPPFGGR
jgi:gluconolactonase